jgi:hypothetical protein
VPTRPGSIRTKRRWRSAFVATCWITSAVGCSALAGYLVYATTGEVRRLTRAVPPAPAEVARDVVIRNVKDEAGNSASFRILLFTDEFRWRINSHTALENTSARFEFSDSMKAVLNDAREIICVGTSSEETATKVAPSKARAEEERRAARRAEQTALWVRQALTKPIPVRKLNVGLHTRTGKPAAETSDQRRMVIILVLDQDSNTNVDQALRSAMARESVRAPIFEALLTRYSLATGPTFTWVH